MYGNYVGGGGTQAYVRSSPLESIVRNYASVSLMASAPVERVYLPTKNYERKTNAQEESYTKTGFAAQAYHFAPADFLTGVATRAINSREELMPLVEEAFEKTTGQRFPENIAITICGSADFAKAFGPGYSDNVLGFCRNRNGFGVSEVFVRKGQLAEVMLTLGHEIGHALTGTLPDARDEEAKAFAFSLGWMETICRHNIGGLKVAITPEPARNGLHNVAYDFVVKTAKAGKDFLRIFIELGKGMLSITHTIEQVISVR